MGELAEVPLDVGAVARSLDLAVHELRLGVPDEPLHHLAAKLFGVVRMDHLHDAPDGPVHVHAQLREPLLLAGDGVEYRHAGA
ncbi:hypothetical protein D3C85_850190 [compost metagenome]